MATSERDRVLAHIGAGRIIAILRGDFAGTEAEIGAVLAEAGVRAIEITMNSPGAPASIERLARGLGSSVAIGAGTVMEPADVDAAADAGARFIVSPHDDPDVVEHTRALDLVSIPGCATPSEMIRALRAGADALKLFPVRPLGPAGVADLRGPLGSARLVPTGGVTPAAARDYIAAGSWAVGVGSALVGQDALAPGGMERLRERARAFVAAVGGGVLGGG